MVKEVKYQLIKKLNKIEIRFYEPIIIVKVEGFGDSGFNILFNYISGNNTTKTNVEMTSPVISHNIEMTTPVLSQEDSIAFVIPDKFTIETTPKPNDDRIEIQKISKRYVAALRFSGRWTAENFTKKSKQLLKELQKSKIETKGKIFVMRYSGPFTPSFLRKNEVAIEIDGNSIALK